MQIWALVVDSFRESLDRKIFWVMLFIALAVASGMFCISFEPHRINLFFGTWTVETDLFMHKDVIATDKIASILVEWIADIILGSVGTFLALIATAGFFPTMMERGGIEVVLSKPLPRWKLVLGKYAGSLVFMGVQASIFIVLTLLVAGIRWKVWLPSYLLVIPLMVLMFSYLYCVSTLVAVYTRSTIAATLITIGAWVVITGVQSLGDTFELYPEMKEFRSAHDAVRMARWAVPKTSDLTLLARKWTRAAAPTVFVVPKNDKDVQMLEGASRAEHLRLAINPGLTIGSSLLFEAAVLAIAIWKFSRKDF